MGFPITQHQLVAIGLLPHVIKAGEQQGCADSVLSRFGLDGRSRRTMSLS
jgi:hypothetical protein